jgi:DNA polymerase-3 subunit delta'
MLVSDIDEPVVAAAAKTPFESTRRVFVIESAETMNEQAANRLLKTLEEPPAYAHLLLVSDRKEEVLATIASRCVHVRFDAPSAETIARGLAVEGERAQACARLALGDARQAGMLASEQGQALRSAAEAYVRSALHGETGQRRWSDLLEAAKVAGTSANEELGERLKEQLEMAPSKERKKLEREAQEGGRRAERRARARALDQGLQLAELWLRDMVCVQAGAGELVYAVDRIAELKDDAARCAGARTGIELVRETRTRIAVNVSEELALEALAFRLQALVET